MRKLNSGQRPRRDERWNHTGLGGYPRSPRAVKGARAITYGCPGGIFFGLVGRRRFSRSTQGTAGRNSKKIQKFSEKIDSVARGRTASLATFSICARKIRVIHAPKLGGLEATNFSLSSQIRKMGSRQRIQKRTEVSIFKRDLLSCLRPISGNDALQLAADEA